MKKIIFFFLIILNTCVYAQNQYDYNWLFGASSVANDTNDYGMNLSFHADSVLISTLAINQNLSLTNATMSDSIGQLLFYTNGCSISNYLGETMENGDSINPGEIHDGQCVISYPMPEGVLVVPKPGSPSKYYVFHQGSIIFSNPNVNVRAFPLYTTTVDMSANFGEGSVTSKNDIVIEDTLVYGGVSAVKHANGLDWWILIQRVSNGDFYRLLVTSDTIEGPFLQNVFQDSTIDTNSSQSVFSPDGTRYVQYKIQDGIYLYDFDRSTGLLSNFEYIPLEEFTLPGGCAISSNSRFLYVNTVTNLYQYDLAASDIGASKVLIGTYDGFQSPFPTSFYLQQLAPDCRIYMTSPNGVDVLHVINHPNRPGLACGFIQRAVQLPSCHVISLPSFPHYRTGTDDPICDSTLVLMTPVFDIPDQRVLDLSVYPNPARDRLSLRLFEPVPEVLIWRLYDALGREYIQKIIAPYEEEVEVDVSALPSGIYFYNVMHDGIIIGNGKLVIGE